MFFPCVLSIPSILCFLFVSSVGRSVGWLVWHNFLKCQDVSIPCSYRSTCWFLDWQLWILPKIPIKVVTSVVSLKISNFLLMGGLYQLRIPWNTIFCYATVQIKFVFIHTIWILKMPLIKFYLNERYSNATI